MLRSSWVGNSPTYSFFAHFYSRNPIIVMVARRVVLLIITLLMASFAVIAVYTFQPNMIFPPEDDMTFRIDGNAAMVIGSNSLPYEIKNSSGDIMQLEHSCVGLVGHGFDEYCENGRIKIVEVPVSCSDALHTETIEIHQQYTWDWTAYYKLVRWLARLSTGHRSFRSFGSLAIDRWY